MDWYDSRNHIALSPAAGGEDDGLGSYLGELGLEAVCAFQTSGSEGLPKWVVLDKEAFLISARSVNAHFEVTAADHWLVALPLHHVGGFSIHARAYLSGSRVTRSQDKWEPENFTRLCQASGITLVSLVPAQVHDLVRLRLASPENLRAVIVGGGGMSQGLAEAALALGWRVFQSYGMTEAASQIATQPYNTFGPVYDVNCLEVLPHWKVDVDQNEALVLSGRALARGYAVRTARGDWEWQPLPDNGWVTRDRVRLWDHGTHRFLAFAGREAGFVKILGELVHLAPLQEVVESLARELDLPRCPILVDVPDARAETRLLLVAEQDGEGLAPLVLRFHQSQPAWLRISETLVVPEIPKTELGKVQMSRLRERALCYSQGRISS